TQTVDVVALDEFIAANRLPSPDFLKVDVDGSELAFLDGAQQTLARPELRAMIFELCKGDEGYPIAIERLAAAELHASEEYVVEPGLYNVVFSRRNTDFRTRETVRHGMD
ncbi:MAG: FkbM family methyltransferase, partial [Planctomycetaceae bacterium]